MNNDSKRTTLSQKYLEIMATMNGHRVISLPTDHANVKIQEMTERRLPKGKRASLFSNREIKGRILTYPEAQVKQGKGVVRFNIEAGIYNEILESYGHQRPTVLFICTWSGEDKGTVIFSKEALSMICTSYWFLPGKKLKPADSSKMVTVEIPDDQFVSATAFDKIFDAIYV